MLIGRNEEARSIDSEEVDAAAIEWFVRLRVENFSDSDRAEFEKWLAASEENSKVFEEIMQMYGHLAGMSPSRRKTESHPLRRAVVAGALAAASLAILLNFNELRALIWSDYRAGIGERRDITLEDGSHVHLDSRSSIALRYGATERRVILLSGEAWFDVAPNPARPFVVEADGGTVTALGTAFDVSLSKTDARIIVAEHSVRVSSGGQGVVVTEGQQTAYRLGSEVEQPSVVDVDRATAWRRGKLIFEKQPLGDVLASLGRYRLGVAYCLDASICARRVNGVFDSDDPAQSLSEIEMSLGVRVIHLTQYITLLY